MKCDDFLPAFAAGGIIRRARANLHAARCTRCARVREGFLKAQREWAHPIAITATHREAWQRASTTQPLATQPQAPRVPKWAFASVACLLLVIAVMVLLRSTHDPAATEIAQKRQSSDALKLPSLAVVQNEHFEEVERGLDRLALELKELEKQADLIDVRQHIDRLSTTYKPLGLSRENQTESN